jgi:hypothetical protein
MMVSGQFNPPDRFTFRERAPGTHGIGVHEIAKNVCKICVLHCSNLLQICALLNSVSCICLSRTVQVIGLYEVTDTFLVVVSFRTIFMKLTTWTVGRTPWTGDRPDARPLPSTHRTTQHRKTRTHIHASSLI